jgi:hypothetical protein
MRGSEMESSLKVNLFFWFVYIPIAIILTPFFVVWEISDNARRGLLFKVR